MHDNHVGFCPREALLVESEQGGVFIEAGEHRLALALVLDAQQVDDVGIGDGLLDIVGHPTAHLLEQARHERAGAAERHVRAEFGQRPDVGAGHPAVENVAQNGDVEPFDLPFPFANGKRVEQGLRGMFMGAVAGVDDAGVEETRKKMGRARRAVANEHDVRVQGLEVSGGVLERLALFERGSLGGKVDHIRSESHGGQLEADAGAGGWFDEEVDHRFAPQSWHFLDGALADGFESARGIEHGNDLVRAERFDIQQMFARPAHPKKWSNGLVE